MKTKIKLLKNISYILIKFTDRGTSNIQKSIINNQIHLKYLLK